MGGLVVLLFVVVSVRHSQCSFVCCVRIRILLKRRCSTRYCLWRKNFVMRHHDDQRSATVLGTIQSCMPSQWWSLARKGAVYENYAKATAATNKVTRVVATVVVSTPEVFASAVVLVVVEVVVVAVKVHWPLPPSHAAHAIGYAVAHSAVLLAGPWFVAVPYGDEEQRQVPVPLVGVGVGVEVLGQCDELQSTSSTKPSPSPPPSVLDLIFTSGPVVVTGEHKSGQRRNTGG